MARREADHGCRHQRVCARVAPTLAAMTAVATIAGGAAGCGDKRQLAQTSTGVANAQTRTPGDDQAVAVAARRAAVPAATNPDEAVVFVRAGSIWIMKPDGSEAIQLTVRSYEAADLRPALSPQGDRIAYAAPVDGVYRIHVMSLDDLLPQVITGDRGGPTGGEYDPAWSPDGAQIAWMSGNRVERRDLYISGADGSAPARVLEGDDDEPEYVGSPAWSPDGRSIVLSADRRQGKGTLLWRLELDGRRLRRLTAPRQGAWYTRDQTPAWSPDGARIAFASNRHASSADSRDDMDIYTIAADGGQMTRLTEDPGSATDPAYSPDGARILFVSDRDNKHAYESELYVMSAGGGVQRRLTRDERPQNRAPSLGYARDDGQSGADGADGAEDGP